MIYAWLKAGHVIFVIFWIAGCSCCRASTSIIRKRRPGSDEERRWIERERSCATIILTPAMILVWVFGLSLVWVNYASGIALVREAWFHAKFAIVFALSGYHGWMVGYGKKLAAGGAAGQRQGAAADERGARHRRGAHRRPGDRPAVLIA